MGRSASRSPFSGRHVGVIELLRDGKWQLDLGVRGDGFHVEAVANAANMGLPIAVHRIGSVVWAAIDGARMRISGGVGAIRRVVGKQAPKLQKDLGKLALQVENLAILGEHGPNLILKGGPDQKLDLHVLDTIERVGQPEVRERTVEVDHSQNTMIFCNSRSRLFCNAFQYMPHL